MLPRPPSIGSVAAIIPRLGGAALTAMLRTSLFGLAALAAAALSCNAAPASAQQGGYRLYPWCAYTGSGEQNCNFSSFEQCRESLGGHGMCTQNSWYAAYGRLIFGRKGGGR